MNMLSKDSHSLKLPIYLFIISFFLIHFGLIVFSYSRPEQFFGWRMFSRPVVYRIHFFGGDPQGNQHPIPPERFRFWLRDKARVYFTATDEFRIFSRGEQYLLNETRRLCEFLCDKLPDQSYQGIQASVEYRQAHDREMNTTLISVSCPDGGAS